MQYLGGNGCLVRGGGAEDAGIDVSASTQLAGGETGAGQRESMESHSGRVSGRSGGLD